MVTKTEAEEISSPGISILDEDAVHTINIITRTFKVTMMVVPLKLISDSMEDGEVVIQGKVMMVLLVGMVVVETIQFMDRDFHIPKVLLLFAMEDEEELAAVNLDAKTVMCKTVIQLKEAVETNRMEAAMELEMFLQRSQLANYIMPRKHMNFSNKLMNMMSMVMNWFLMNGNIRGIAVLRQSQCMGSI